MEVEERVAHVNSGLTDPVARIAGGMKVAAAFAQEQPRRTMVLLRSQTPATSEVHPLNRGLKEDIEAALAEGMLRPEAHRAGLLYWLGLCQVLMVNFIEIPPTREEAAQRIGDMLLLGLVGLGVSSDRARELASLV